MDAYLVLADAAHNEQETGKLGILGAGWSLIGPAVPPMSVVIFLRTTIEEAVQPVEFTLRLTGAGREPVPVSSDGAEPRPLVFTGRIRLIDEDQPLDELAQAVGAHSSFAVNIGSLPLPAGRAYTWVLEVVGKEVATVTFGVRGEAIADDDGPFTV